MFGYKKVSLFSSSKPRRNGGTRETEKLQMHHRTRNSFIVVQQKSLEIEILLLMDKRERRSSWELARVALLKLSGLRHGLANPPYKACPDWFTVARLSIKSWIDWIWVHTHLHTHTQSGETSSIKRTSPVAAARHDSFGDVPYDDWLTRERFQIVPWPSTQELLLSIVARLL